MADGAPYLRPLSFDWGQAAVDGKVVPLAPDLHCCIQAWCEVNTLPNRNLMRDGRWQV